MAVFLKKYWVYITIIIVFILASAFAAIFFLSTEKSENLSKKNGSNIRVFYEEIPGSKNHSPDGTWWGYNMTKIARFGNTVYMFVIHNDDDPPTSSKFTVYKKKGEGDWEKGAQFSTSRSGNILVDSTGVLHAFVFEAIDMVENDSRGKLIHYWFPDTKSGDITNFKKEIVVDIDDIDNETVNIRVGAAIGVDDTMAVTFGSNEGPPDFDGQVEHIYYKKPLDGQWVHEIAGKNLGHDWYYPFALVGNKRFHILPVQDDFVAEDEPNIYQKILYFEKKSGDWKQEMIVDLSKHELASSRRRLLEQSDLFEDSSGNIHIIYKESLSAKDEYTTSAFKHLIKKNGKWGTTSLDLRSKNINWLRLIEVEETLYYIATSGSQLYITKSGSTNLTKISVPRSVKGIYPYVSQPKTGTRVSEKFVDILLLAGDGKAYPNATNAYVRIPKSEFSKIK